MINLSADATVAVTFAVVFSTGFLSGLSPCTLPTVVFITAYVSGKKINSKKRGFILSLAFILGIAFMLSILGVFAGFMGKIIANEQVLYYIIAAILLIMGLWLLKVLKFNPNYSFSKINPKRGSGILGAFLFGIPFGIAASPCTLPITLSVLAYSAIKGSVFFGMLLMFTFAIGRSIPLLLVGTFTGILKNIKAFSKYQSIIEKVGGIIMILLAAYFIWQAVNIRFQFI
ncbi:MAG: cytochrome c biogenesis CcdA family protein [Actinobacteria bacterium]|nr:cytochrome c biogenesis CcdA family protein [Actinomycetota bacterium]